MNLMLTGAIGMASFTASLFFLRFWKTTRDRFFLFFAVSLSLEAIVRILLGIATVQSEERPLVYVLRLLAFLLILAAIVDKNWINRRPAEKP